MNARTVRRHLRQAKRQRRREEAEQRRQATGRSTRPPGSGARVLAVVVAAGVAGIAVGSAVQDPRGETWEPAPVDAAAFPAAGSGTAHVCPPMPGLAASLTTDGLLQYRQRDDSALGRFQALVLAADDAGTFPAAAWAQLGERYRVNTTELTEAEETVTGDVVYDVLGAMTRTPFLEIEALPEGASGAAAARYTYAADTGPVTGLATRDCTVPQRSHWFFGPELGAGATALLTLANPYDRPATVEVVGYDTDGHRGSSGTRTLVVPGETVRTVNLAALAGTDAELGISVESSGAPVTAQVQSSRAVGLTGQGVDFLPGISAPDTEHVMPGVPVPESTEDDPAARPAELWIHSAGQSRTTLELQVYGDDGVELLDNPAVFTVEPGEVDAVPLQGLEAGVYDVVLRSDEPTYAAVSSHGVAGGDGDSATDFSWQASAVPLTEGSGTIIPDVGESSLRLTSLQVEGQVAYRLVEADGTFSAAEEVTVPAEGALTLEPEDLGDAVAVVVEETAPGLYAALTTQDEGGLALSTVDLLRDPDRTVPVRLRH
ncbi:MULTISPECIES: DUF5719 family protein [Actinomycetes]|uniref:Uncharacterized protein n=2 Tax=Actinomycetes TaxID=1760 RepID=A0ABP6M5K3_9MICC